MLMEKTNGRIYYVSTNGCDSDCGTSIDNPFKTIQKAADVMEAGDVCYIRGGVYRETVIPKNSGRADNPIVFAPYENENVTVSGLDIVESAWDKYKENIYKTKLKWDNHCDGINSVFVDGEMMNEARWPNTGTDLLKPTLATMNAGTDVTHIVDEEIPDIDWTGGDVWFTSKGSWSSTTGKIIDYDRATSTITFENNMIWPLCYADEGGKYFLYGKLEALDAEREWYYDSQNSILYLYAPNVYDPGAKLVEYKSRLFAFDLTRKSYINIENINIFGATITTENANNCVIDGIKAKYISHYNRCDGTTSPVWYHQKCLTGIMIKGEANIIKNSEIAFSSGNGILVNGINHQIINNYIHDTDYSGTYAACIAFAPPINERGEEYSGNRGIIISHNTAERTGRSVLDANFMEDCLIQYNNFHNCGYLTKDLGILYVVRTDGANSEFRYNWLHTNKSEQHGFGLYFDNASKNYIAHHNVIWGVEGASIVFNHHSIYNLIYNNTGTSKEVGLLSCWRSGQTHDMTGTRIVNNLFNSHISCRGISTLFRNNVWNYEKLIDNKYLPEGSEYIGKGIEMVGIKGSTSDIGAYQHSEEPWVAGHNFEKIPEFIDVARSKPIHRNLLVNPSFERGTIEPWEMMGDNVTLHHEFCDIDESGKVGMPGVFSVILGEGKTGIKQKVTGLKPNTTYLFSGYIKTEEDATAYVGVEDHVYGDFMPIPPNTNWINSNFMFTTGPETTSVIVFAWKDSEGSGKVYCDDFGLSLAEDM